MMINFSTVSDHITSQPMFEILSRVQELERTGQEILHFELGEPDFSTPDNIKAAAINAINGDQTKYAPSGGLHEFKEVVQETTLKSRGFKPELNQILITPGANSIIYFALKCVINPGDEIIVPDPGFPTYYSAIHALGGIPKPLKLNENDDFSFSHESLEQLITHQTKAIILNSPSNPTGQTLSSNLVKKVYEISAKNNILLISDEIYARVIFDDTKFASPSTYDECKGNTLILNGFSKAFSMTGWRLGVAIGPENLIQKMTNLTSTIASCVPPFIQIAGIAAVTGDQRAVKHMVKTYHERSKILVNGLNSVKGISCLMPKGAIYAFPNITGTGMNSAQFSELLLRKCNIAVTPGHCFGANGEGYVRFSTVNGDNTIREALRRITDLFGTKPV